MLMNMNKQRQEKQSDIYKCCILNTVHVQIIINIKMCTDSTCVLWQTLVNMFKNNIINKYLDIWVESLQITKYFHYYKNKNKSINCVKSKMWQPLWTHFCNILNLLLNKNGSKQTVYRSLHTIQNHMLEL